MHSSYVTRSLHTEYRPTLVVNLCCLFRFSSCLGDELFGHNGGGSVSHLWYWPRHPKISWQEESFCG